MIWPFLQIIWEFLQVITGYLWFITSEDNVFSVI